MLRQRPVDRIHELLPMLYAFWALAALGRAIYQYVARQPHDALPTHLSALAGLLYLVIAGLLRCDTPQTRRWVRWLLLLELGSVLVVGSIDWVWRPFAYTSVWSAFGAGYGFMPLLLPLAGLWWLARQRVSAAE
jgi:hypothetical protein